MPDKFDLYREALVMETSTNWPAEFDDLDLKKKERLAAAVHADPENAALLAYVRMHSGFCREITITADDVARVRGK
jgi:hypothetical protein